jgi:A/G-specific adenine glycosylase
MKPEASFTQLILGWYEQNGRKFPWRKKTDPYQVLIAEIMLQRTKAEQVAPVYLDFIREFPTIDSLSLASEEQIGKFFLRLGLLWRASLVKQMAKDIVKRFNGKIPSDREALLSIPAIGDYIADSVLAFAYNGNVSVVDVNVCRVIARVFGLKPQKEARRDPIFKKILKELLPEGESKKFNWAIIDLASLICLPKKPLCWKCPLNRICQFAKTQY